MKRSLIFIFLLFSFLGNAQPARKVFQNMLNACERNRSGKFTLISYERMENGKMAESKMLVKYLAEPKTVYLYCVYPNAGTEVLFRKGWINDRLFIHPTGFPFVNIKLSPFHPLVRKDAHHTVYQIGFDYIAGMIRYYSGIYGERFYRYLQLKDTVMFDNRTLIHLQYEFKEYQQIKYTVQAGENVTAIAAKFHLNDCSILALNPDVSGFNDVKAGEQIRIPNFYNRRVDFFVDSQNWLPLIQEVYDDKGLFERYEVKSYIHEPHFSDDEFTPSFKDYRF